MILENQCQYVGHSGGQYEGTPPPVGESGARKKEVGRVLEEVQWENAVKPSL